jgi:hypothetical protein
MGDYQEFLRRKLAHDVPQGIPHADTVKLNPKMFPFQAACVRFALKRGRAALFEDCGLGKTFQQIEWARVVAEHTGRPVIILAPLAVAQQTIAEGERLGVKIDYCRSQDQVTGPLTVANYEMLHHFNPAAFAGVVVDESSILKNFTGKIRTAIIEAFERTPFKLSCTATPAPNDYMELGNQAEFLGVMSRTEMLAMYFVHDGGETSQWRLKGHAEDAFWRWMCSWSVCLRRPSDIGFDDIGYDLPALNTKSHLFDAQVSDGYLIPMPAMTLLDQRAAKREGLSRRVGECAAMVNASKEPWIVWGELNDECDELERMIPDAVQVAGRDSIEDKEARLMGFARGEHRVLISKSSIAGFGLNFQHCNNMAFVNLSHSFEDQYQAIRRCWRFGQTKPVNVHLFLLESEVPILENVTRKQQEADAMSESMIRFMRESMQAEIGATKRQKTEYKPATKMELPSWMKSSSKKPAKAGRFTMATAAK